MYFKDNIKQLSCLSSMNNAMEESSLLGSVSVQRTMPLCSIIFFFYHSFKPSEGLQLSSVFRFDFNRRFGALVSAGILLELFRNQDFKQVWNSFI